MEPNMIAQTAESMSGAERKAWIMKQIEAARAKGLGFFRAAYDPEHNITLLECWQIQPEDQGEPRFEFASLNS